MRIEQLRKNYDIEVRWAAFPLHPETPEEGFTLEELFAGQPIDIKKIMVRLKQVADELVRHQGTFVRGVPGSIRNQVLSIKSRRIQLRNTDCGVQNLKLKRARSVAPAFNRHYRRAGLPAPRLRRAGIEYPSFVTPYFPSPPS